LFKTIDLRVGLKTKEVNMLEPIYIADVRATPYIGGVNFCQTFTEEMPSLYLLAFLLTADNDKAEKCFISAMEECIEGIGVTDWVPACARRAIIKHAVRTIMPVPEQMDTEPSATPKRSAISGKNSAFADIVALCAFERFVFVISVLEGQSDQECAVLLRCSRADVMISRVLALKRLANTDAAYAQAGDIAQA
jgi:hypothetical protein